MLQYKRVCIPHVGTFELVQQSAQLNIADKIFTPPFFTTKYSNEEKVTDHQFIFFASSEQTEEEKLKRELLLFGKKLKTKIQNAPFKWNGFGTLCYAEDELTFEPQPFSLTSLQLLPANKIMRENVQHSMLVGDQQMTSQQVTDALNKHEHTEKKGYWFIIAGWTIFIIAVIVILILLYLNKFQITSTGLQTKTISYLHHQKNNL